MPDPAANSIAEPQRQVVSVSQLTQQIKDTLQTGFASVWVSGELSDVVRPASGHVYFTLKDEQAQIGCVLWRSAAARLKFRLEDGLAVVCRGQIDVYPPRGKYQLDVRLMEPQGEGALQLALRQLRARLDAEGLFAAERKRPLPPLPRRVGFVTSPSGAAVRDFLEVLRRRWRGLEVFVIPARVQGEGAAAEIAAGIASANRLRPALDVLVVGRGGGSLEDLWCFNEETVVRAIAGSRVPVVSAVGHEIDVTLADLAADVRALTPSEAAERIVPLADEMLAQFAHVRQRLAQGVWRRCERARLRLEAVRGHRVFRRPLDRCHELARRLDERAEQLQRVMGDYLARRRERVQSLTAQLESLSPLAVLARGYSLTTLSATGAVVRSAQQLAPGDEITTRLARGTACSRVTSVKHEAM